jgi:hypothetical protein
MSRNIIFILMTLYVNEHASLGDERQHGHRLLRAWRLIQRPGLLVVVYI